MKPLLIIFLSCCGAMAQTKGWPQFFMVTNSFGGLSSSNNVRPAIFQPYYQDPITNIVILTNFEGTIQIGDRFFTVQDLKSIPSGNFSIWNATQTIPALETNWVGCPMVSDNDPYTPSEAWLPNVEMGLRSDGVVIWKSNLPK